MPKIKPEKTTYIQETFSSSPEWREVKQISEEFFQILCDPHVVDRINDANQPGRSSHEVQSVIEEATLKLGFTSEKKGLFSKYKNPKLRPDFFRKVGDTGIIVEVERGKTNINNMDLLDFWKCHICEEVNYLFLCVPVLLIQDREGRRKSKPYQVTTKHMSSFFEPENYTNVRGVVIFGY